ncbi:hypothetical protein SK128_011764 [Halocaridina rubra]|uniref:Uncharacterized protein n=1 Tax=Halocaridina rubra TaxID=373956 RepID=A0AAN8XDD0_HALRR
MLTGETIYSAVSLLPFLKIGITFACSQHLGISPDSSDFLNMILSATDNFLDSKLTREAHQLTESTIDIIGANPTPWCFYFSSN